MFETIITPELPLTWPCVTSVFVSGRAWIEPRAVSRSKAPFNDLYCLTTPCVSAAADMLRSSDVTTNPCDDFYKYACGGWVKNNPIPDGKSMWGTFGKLEHRNQLIIKNVLERSENDLESDAEKKARRYYISCMDANETIEALGAEPLLDILNKTGGWNISGNFDIHKWDLQETLHSLQNRYNMGGLFTWAVGEDDRNSSRHIIQVSM
uniref:Peptidase M13 N-terminal domain-containing protein n=1 Tax=Timema cristinae TaxID=61476 RepID=A0A7R9HDC1_TIMCR|nr:unnamed protein product [Timema cristinae]